VLAAAAKDPYLWSALAALLLGLALGQAIRWIATPRRAGIEARVRRERSSARALALVGLALLPATALLVFPAKASLQGAALPAWAAAVLAAGLLAGLWPRAAGLPMAAVALGAFLFLDAGLAGWLPFSGPGPVASLLPYEASGGAAGAASFRGELELAERDSVPVVQEIGMASADAALAVESLDLSGPLGLAALLAKGEGRFYRVVGLVGSGAAPELFPPPSGLLGRLAPLGPGEGLEPGAAPERRLALLGFFERRRSTSPSSSIVALEPLRFALGEEMEALIASEPEIARP
jgi:hypothetical protein